MPTQRAKMATEKAVKVTARVKSAKAKAKEKSAKAKVKEKSAKAKARVRAMNMSARYPTKTSTLPTMNNQEAGQTMIPTLTRPAQPPRLNSQAPFQTRNTSLKSLRE